MAASSAAASPYCVSVATETDSEESSGVGGNLGRSATPPGLTAGRIDTESESESSGPGKLSVPESVVKIQMESDGKSGTEGHAPRKRRKCQRHPQSPSSSSDAPDRHSAMDSKPVSSGCFDFITWVVSERLESAELDKLCKKFPLRVGSMCSGMATEELALAALHHALSVKGLPAKSHISVFKAETDPRKVKFLRERLPADTPIFADNACLAQAARHAHNGGTRNWEGGGHSMHFLGTF